MYRYASSSKQFTFRSDSPLSNDQIARHAPSVLATEAHESRWLRSRQQPKTKRGSGPVCWSHQH